MQLLSFDGIDLPDVVPRILRKGRCRMPFGIIELDYDGRSVAYNMGAGPNGSSEMIQPDRAQYG